MADYPPLSRFYVASYAANDRDYPVVAIRLDPRTAGYRVPEDLSPHPDSKRYPNHVFTGAQPASGDQIVTHIYEILPAPYVPFTRYDDDLGPIQGRRRSVKNEGQVARLGPDQRVNYEAREGSAIVYTEIEEAWSVATDEDGNSLFPIKDRDFYDASRGAVQERRQLFVPTGEEEGTLENVNGVITQTSYEPYNEFLSVKIVQTYKVDGPQLIGKATDEARQLATVTTQRKGSADYVPPNPTATRTVEVSSEDAESLVERIVEVPEVFGAESYRKTREDITPQKFKAAQEDVVFEQTIEGTANPSIVLGVGEFVKSEEQVNKFTKRVSTTSRSITSAVILLEKVLTPQGQVGTRTLRLDVGDQSFTPSATLIDASVEALGDGRTVKTEVTVPSVFTSKTIRKTRLDLTPEKFRAAQSDTIIEENLAGAINQPSSITLGAGEFAKSEEQVTEFVKRISTNTRDVSAATDLEETVITQQGQVATRTLRLSADPQSIQPDALLVDGSIEALGDGRTIKTEVRVPNVFPQTLLRVEKPITIPERFLVNNPTTTEAETVADEDPSVELIGDAISQQVERTGEFVTRKTTVERSLAADGPLSGADYDELSNSQIPFTESVSTSIPSGPCEADPLGGGRVLVKQYNLSGIESNLSSVMLSFPTRSSIAGIPPVLKKLDVQFEESTVDSTSNANGSGSADGKSGSISAQASAQARATVSCIPKFIVELEEVNAVNIPTTSYFFFLKYPVTLQSILNKVGAQQWPVFKPRSYTITATGQTVVGSLSVNKEAQRNWASESSGYSRSNGLGSSKETSNQIIVLNIPPCIHGGFSKNTTKKVEETISASAVLSLSTGTEGPQNVPTEQDGFPDFNPLLIEAEAKVEYNLTATSPSSVPTGGTYLINSNVQPYKFGFAKVYAEVVSASVFA
jgi:hypothetical protein